MKTLSGPARHFSFEVQTLLQKALDLRDRYRLGEISKHGMAVATGRLESCLDRWLNRRLSVPDNRRFAQHLAHEQPWIFSFLHCPGLDATNNVAERAIGPAVVARHTWGGNRTATGAGHPADPHERVAHLLATAKRLLRQFRSTTWFSRLPNSRHRSNFFFPIVGNSRPSFLCFPSRPLFYSTSHSCARRAVKH